MVNDDSFSSRGPLCPVCGSELDAEPVAVDHTLRIGYSCSVHGIVSVAGPFDET